MKDGCENASAEEYCYLHCCDDMLFDGVADEPEVHVSQFSSETYIDNFTWLEPSHEFQSD